MNTTAIAERRASPMAEVRLQLGQLEGQFQNALPAHIPVERFMRVVFTALQNNQKLLDCDRQSLFNSAMKAAQDGLLPDGRDGAIVQYGQQAQWMVMIGGLRKKVRNSDEIATWEAHCVYKNDEFDYQLGDDPFIRHKPALGERGEIIGAYSVAVFKDGTRSREVMSIGEIEAVRGKSRAAKNGPWADPVFYPEMCRKTVARRHSKVLPMSSDLDDLIRRDDHLYDFEGARTEAKALNRPTLASSLDRIAGKTGETHSPAAPSQSGADEAGATPAESGQERPDHAPAISSAADESGASSADERSAPATRHPTPAGADSAGPNTESEYVMRCGAIIDRAKTSKELEGFLDREDEKALQQSCGVSDESLDMIFKSMSAKYETLKKKGK